MFQIYCIAGFFSLQFWRESENAKKTNRLTKDEIKKELISSMVNNDVIETAALNEKADRVEKLEDAIAVVRAQEDIIRTKKGYYMHRVPTRKGFHEI